MIDEKNIFDPTLRPGKLPYYEPETPNFLPTDLSVVEQSIALDLADDYMSGHASQLPKKIYFDTIVNVDGVPIHLGSCVPNYTAKALQSFSSTVEVAQFASEIYGNYKYHNGLNRDFFIESSIDLGKSVAGFAAGAVITASSMSLIPAIVAGAATAYGIHEFGEWLKRKFVY